MAVFATSLDLCSWVQDNIFDSSAVVNSSSFNYGYTGLCDNYMHIVLVYIHSVNTNMEVSNSFPNNTDTNYYVQTFASKVTLNGSTQQNVSYNYFFQYILLSF